MLYPIEIEPFFSIESIPIDREPLYPLDSTDAASLLADYGAAGDRRGAKGSIPTSTICSGQATQADESPYSSIQAFLKPSFTPIAVVTRFFTLQR